MDARWLTDSDFPHGRGENDCGHFPNLPPDRLDSSRLYPLLRFGFGRAEELRLREASRRGATDNATQFPEIALFDEQWALLEPRLNSIQP